jgi:hypothetical protein
MDFVGSREDEKRFGWRNRVGQFLRRLGVIVFDPWFKPEVRGVHEYGKESEAQSIARANWTFADNKKGAAQRADCAAQFWPALHSDLRMVDTSDFIVAYCPTNVYSVGTPHEIILARQQRKPVLFVSPPVELPALSELRKHLERNHDAVGCELLEQLVKQGPINDNALGVPSQWYMPLIGGEHFFDGFGFYLYRKSFAWPQTPLDATEEAKPPEKPLLPFLARLNKNLPLKWDRQGGDYGPNDDWILWKLTAIDQGHELRDVPLPE